MAPAAAQPRHVIHAPFCSHLLGLLVPAGPSDLSTLYLTKAKKKNKERKRKGLNKRAPLQIILLFIPFSVSLLLTL